MLIVGRALLLIVCVCIFNFELHAGSLDETVRRAVKTSPSLGEAESTKAAVTQDVAQAKGSYLPRLDVEASVGPQWADKPRSLNGDDNRSWTNGRQAAIVLRQTLFDGFARDSELLRQKARLGGALSRILEQTEAVALAATESHVDVVRQREILKAADANVAAHRAIQKDIEDRHAGGGATLSELEQIRERVAAAEASRADFARSLGVAEARYEKVTGAAPLRLSPPRAPRTPVPPVDQAVAMALAANPGLSAARSETAAAEADVDVARSRYAPQVGVELRASRGNDLGYAEGKSNEAGARLTVGWNLFNGGTDDARVRQRIEQANAQRFRVDRLGRDLRETIAADWAIRRTGVDRIAALRRALDLSRRVVTAYMDEYQAGRRSLLDVLDARASEFQAQVSLAGAQAIALMAQYRIIAATGQMAREFRLERDGDRVPLPAPFAATLR